MRITPAGNFDFDWVPKSSTDKNVKTASEQQYDAVKKAGFDIPGVASEENKGCEKCKCSPCKCEKTEKESCMGDSEAVVIDVDPVASPEGSSAMPDAALDVAKEDGLITPLEGEKVEDVAAVTVEQATAKIEDAVEEIKGAVGVAKEVELEVSEEGALLDGKVDDKAEIDVSFEEGSKGDNEKEADIEKTSKEDKKSPASASPASASPASASPASCDKKDACEASADDEFVRYAKISPSNRKKLIDFWKKDLGYVPEYVKLMTMDYEK